MSEWISVEDRLPESGKSVNVFGKIWHYWGDPNKEYIRIVGTAMIYSETGHWTVPHFCSGIESELDIYDITHWQELPPPPIVEQA